jgi:prepilin-type N-terminal cleavage/methylation domain-containing protein
MTKKSVAGFTLLEILVVIIIVGVLASVALPSLFRNVERSRATEALNTLGIIRRGIEACAMQFGGTTTNCSTFNNIGMSDPSAAAGVNASAHFTYGSPFGGLGANGAAQIVATRVSLDGGTTSDTITLTKTTAGVLSRSGSGNFAGIQ